MQNQIGGIYMVGMAIAYFIFLLGIWLLVYYMTVNKLKGDEDKAAGLASIAAIGLELIVIFCL